MATQKKNSLVPGILQAIGLAACGYSTFVGLAYWTNGSLGLSVIGAIFALIILLLLVYFMEQWKQKKLQSNTDLPNKVPEIVLGSVYAVVFICLFIVDYHYANIEFVRKNDIKSLAVNKLDDISNLKAQYATAITDKVNRKNTTIETAKSNYWTVFNEYDRITYRSQLDSLLGNRSVSYDSRDRFDETYRPALKSVLRNERKKYTIDSFDTKTDDYLLLVRPVFTEWRFLSVGYYYNDIDRFRAEYYQAAQGKMSDFKFDAPGWETIPLNDPIASIKGAGIVWLIVFLIVMVLVHLCILAPYIAAKRQHVPLKANATDYNNQGSITAFLNQKSPNP